jgi:EAL domain-containing protein (putative c-di-GMP-specific phosphodiesterase class I)
VLQPLRALGVHVALDDFGTGFSSLGYLDVLPVDELKIDRRFVAGLGVRPQDEALVRHVLNLAADLGLRVVAEGVEKPAQARTLVELGCGMAQGLLFGPAVPVERLAPAVPVERLAPAVPVERPAPAVPVERLAPAVPAELLAPTVVDLSASREAGAARVVTGGD